MGYIGDAITGGTGALTCYASCVALLCPPPKVNPKVNPKTNPKVNPKTNPKVNPKVGGKVNSKVSAKVGGRFAPKIGAIEFSNIAAYGFGNETNETTIIQLAVTNLTTSYDARNAFKLALQVPKSEYVVSLVNDIYCAPGIDNTETCRILLDADQEMKDDFGSDWDNDYGGVKSSIENRWYSNFNTISDNVYNKWWNDNRIQGGYEFYSSILSFQGRVISSSGGIWFKEGDGKRILVENQSLLVDYYVDDVWYDYVDFHFTDPAEEAAYGNEYRQFIADYYDNTALPDMETFILNKEQEILKPKEEERVNNDSKFESLRAVHTILGLSEAMKQYNVPKPSFIDGYNCYPSCDTSDLRNSSIPNPDDYDIDPNALNGIEFGSIPLHRTGHISEEEFTPPEPPNTTEANWTIYIGEVDIVGAGDTMDNITFFSFNETDVILVLPETKPELIIPSFEDWSIEFTPNESINAGEQVKINATIFNFGTTNATDVVVKFYDGDPNNGGSLIGTDTVDVSRIGFNDSQVTWTATFGDHNIYVEVDPDNLIDELNESNNVANKSISVSGNQSDWHNCSFQYRKPITIDNTQNPENLTDYQTLVILNSSNFNFSKAKSDGGDIRFVDGSEELDYWIEEWDNEKV